MEATTATNVGYIEEIQGVVIEAVFHDKLPEINNAITVLRGSGAEEVEGIAGTADELLVCEVQQHLARSRWTPPTGSRAAR
jgi:F-type H+-transporting ATPase subunit beta